MAKAVTIARVASRLSTIRRYQPLVLQGLKSFFDGNKRLIKQGDLLAVKVDLNRLPYLQAASTGDGSETGALGMPEKSVLSTYLSPKTWLDVFAGSRITRQTQRISYILS
jgi:hypothetical protein